MLRLLDVRNPNASEARDAAATLDVGIRIEIDITPDDAILQSSIVVGIAVDVASSTAAGRVGKAFRVKFEFVL